MTSSGIQILQFRVVSSSSVSRQSDFTKYTSCIFEADKWCYKISHIISEHELTFTFVICCRLSVYRLSVCRLSVTLVHPTQAVANFRNFSTPFGALAIP